MTDSLICVLNKAILMVGGCASGVNFVVKVSLKENTNGGVGIEFSTLIHKDVPVCDSSGDIPT